jgi:hypothetical protein
MHTSTNSAATVMFVPTESAVSAASMLILRPTPSGSQSPPDSVFLRILFCHHLRRVQP